MAIGGISRQFSIEILLASPAKALADGNKRDWQKLVEIPDKKIGTNRKCHIEVLLHTSKKYMKNAIKRKFRQRLQTFF